MSSKSFPFIIICFFLHSLGFAQEHFSVFFDTNKAILTSSENKKLQEWMSSHPKDKIVAINGFTDKDGSSELNDTLAQKRVDFIYKILEDAYNSGMVYDASDMKSAVLAFAATSTHQSEYCIDLISKMKWSSEPAKVIQVDFRHGSCANWARSGRIRMDILVFAGLFHPSDSISKDGYC